MRTGISITVKPSDRKRLKAILRDRNAPQKHVWRAQIVLLTAEGLGTWFGNEAVVVLFRIPAGMVFCWTLALGLGGLWLSPAPDGAEDQGHWRPTTQPG